MPGRNAQVARIFSLLNVLENSGRAHTVSELHQRLLDLGHSAGKRTIYRDLETLCSAGFPLSADGAEGETQKWRLERKTQINDYFVITAKELFALYLAQGVLKPLANSPIFDDLIAVFQRIEERLGIKQSKYLNSLAEEIRFEPGPQWGLNLNLEILETIRAACAEGQVLSGLYYSANSGTETIRKIGPHYLYYAKGGLYLVAEELESEKIKIFAVPRFRSIEMLGEEYNAPIQTPDQIFDGSLGIFSSEKTREIVIEFATEVAEYVRERRWHPSQRVVNLEGGRIRMTLEAADNPELYSWILGFGARARVISPEEVAEKVAIKASETVALYRRKAG
jgi:proteasome accessory factor B